MILILFTGLSGSGKSTLAFNLQKKLKNEFDYDVEIIDGDVSRLKFCKDLGFSKEDRYKSIRRLFSIGKDLIKSKKIVLMSIINPYEDLRIELTKYNFVKLVYLDCDIENLIKKDPKGLYKKALLPDTDPNKIKNFTGISDIYEIPKIADLILKTDVETEEVSTNKLFKFVTDFLK